MCRPHEDQIYFLLVRSGDTTFYKFSGNQLEFPNCFTIALLLIKLLNISAMEEISKTAAALPLGMIYEAKKREHDIAKTNQERITAKRAAKCIHDGIMRLGFGLHYCFRLANWGAYA